MEDQIIQYLNDNMVEPDEHLSAIMKMLDIEFVSEEDGWQLRLPVVSKPLLTCIRCKKDVKDLNDGLCYCCWLDEHGM